VWHHPASKELLTERMSIDDVPVNIHSIELPKLSSKDYLFFAIQALAYVASGLWVGMAPQPISQPAPDPTTQSPVIYSHYKKLPEPVEIIASDLESTPMMAVK